MSDLKTILTKVVNRRRLTGGEFSYVFRPTGESVTGKKAVWGMVKADAEAYNKLKKEAGLDEEEETQFDTRALKMIPLVGYEEENVKEDDMDVKEGGEDSIYLARDLTCDEFFRKVCVEYFDKKSSPEECESFLRQYDNVLVTKRVVFANKAGKELFKGSYEVTFKDDESAANFLSLPEIKFQDKVLSKKLRKTLLQERTLRRMHTAIFSHNKRISECLAVKGEEGKQVFVFGIGVHLEEEIQEFFLGLESEFVNITTARTVYFQQGTNKKCLGYLLSFEDDGAAEDFCKKDDKKFKEKELRSLKISSIIASNQMYRNKANFEDDGVEYSESEAGRRIVLLRVNEQDVTKAETKIREMFQNVANVHRSAADKGIIEHITIVTFATADDAKAALKVPVESELIRPVNVMGMEEYLEERGKVLVENKERMDKSDKKYNNIRDNFVKVEGNKVVVTDPSDPPAKEKKKKEAKKVETAKAAVATNGKNRAVQTDSLAQGALARRKNRGSSDWDLYVTVGGLTPKMKNLGKPSDMDICNYFLHNHKDVADVKFLNWTDVVFVKFQDVVAAERFLSLSYVMFYGSDLNRNDVETFMKKKNPAQKEEVAKVLLGKKLGDVTGNTVTNNTAAVKASAGKGPLEVELSTFTSKNSNVRDLFISELHLSEGDVGQPNWVKADQKFTARLPVKLEENAIGYLVRKWNDLQINVGGETVNAQVANCNKALKREGTQPKPGKAKKNAKKQKFNFYENY